MPVFTKESHNHFDVDHFEVDNSFGFRIESPLTAITSLSRA